MSTIGFIEAAGYLIKGWQLVRVKGLRKFVLIPLAINIMVFAGLGWLLFGVFTDWISSWTLFERFGDVWLLAGLQTVLQFVAGMLLGVAMLYLFTLLANLVGAPFNSLLSERVEQYLTGTSPTSDPSLMFMLKSLPKTMSSEVAKLIYLGLWLLPLLLITFIPVINVAAPFLWFMFGAWMFSLEYIDYPLGNHGLGFRQVKKQLKLRRGTAMGFGSAVGVASIIPVVNLVIMPVAVAGATALYVDAFKQYE